MRLRIITPQKELLNTDVDSAILPGDCGEMEILPGHAMLVSTLASGAISYSKDGIKNGVNIGMGLVEVMNDGITALVTSSS